MCPPRTDSTEFVFNVKKIRCLLVHDHVLLRQGLRRLLQDEPDFDLVGEASNAAECLRKVHELCPDVVVADAEAFGLAPWDAERLVRRECPQTNLVFLSGEEGASFPLGSLRRAVAGCALRQTSAAELVEMVRRSCGTFTNRDTAKGIAYRIPNGHVSNSFHEPSLAHEPRLGAPALFPAGRSLTTREREVLKMLAEGKTVRATATALGLSSKTVDAHKFNLMRKLGIHNKAELVMWAIQKRVVKIPASF